MELTRREQDVLDLIGQGKGCDDIASELEIAPLTVRKHRSNMLAKLGHHSTAQLVAHAVASRPASCGVFTEQDLDESLSRREREIFHLIAGGLTSKEIARRIDISPSTVRKHRERVMRKLGAHHVADIIGLAEALRLRRTSTDPGESEVCSVSVD